MNTRAYIPVLMLTAVVGARSLVDAWRDSPYAQLGWLAFLLWISPCLCRNTVRKSLPVWAYYSSGLLAAAGVMLDVHTLNHAALALAFAGFCPSKNRTLVWSTAALSWIPAAGYGVARLGFSPPTVCALAVLIALIPCVVSRLQRVFHAVVEVEVLHG